MFMKMERINFNDENKMIKYIIYDKEFGGIKFGCRTWSNAVLTGALQCRTTNVEGLQPHLRQPMLRKRRSNLWD